ncbi:AEC family transporter [Sphingobium algorifonticola]|nr:AEC family transporter [Sphingobium algorifonticola]
MLSSLLAILPVFLIVLSGFGASKVGIIGSDAASLLNRFVIWIALPCLLFDVVGTTDWNQMWHPGFAIASLGGSFAVFALGLVVGKMRGLRLGDVAIDGMNASYSNAVFIGLPMLTLALGPAARPHVVVAGTVTLTALFAAGVMLIEADRAQGNGMARAAWRILTGMARNPVIVSPLAGLLWWLTGWPLAAPVKQFLELLGGTASPVALVAVGLFLSQRPLVAAVVSPAVWLLSCIKLIVHPAITAFLAWRLLALPNDIAVTAIAIAALPTGTGPFMIAEFYARDGRVTSGTIMLTTLLSVGTIAAVLFLLR